MKTDEPMSVDALRGYVTKSCAQGERLYKILERVVVDFIQIESEAAEAIESDEDRLTQHAVILAALDLLCNVSYASNADPDDLCRSIHHLYEQIEAWDTEHRQPRDVSSDEARAKQGDKSVS